MVSCWSQGKARVRSAVQKFSNSENLSELNHMHFSSPLRDECYYHLQRGAHRVQRLTPKAHRSAQGYKADLAPWDVGIKGTPPNHPESHTAHKACLASTLDLKSSAGL